MQLYPNVSMLFSNVFFIISIALAFSPRIEANIASSFLTLIINRTCSDFSSE